MRDVLEVPIEDSSSINPVSVLIVNDSSLKESNKQAECPKNQFRTDIFSDEVSICRICHGEEGDKDSVYEKEVDKLGQQSAGLAFITINPDRTQVSPASNNSGSLSTSNSLKSSSTDQMISQMCLISPCCCAGSLKYVHPHCLQQWIRSSGVDSCELCKQIFNMSVSYKPFYKWKSPDMSSAEKRKLFFNLLFNLVSMLCVFWSIYVLIERATFEAKYGLLDWPFWTKMLVVSIGFLGGSVFLFVQIRLYISIFLRWRQFNRIITIHNANNDDKSNDHKSDRSSEIGSNSIK